METQNDKKKDSSYDYSHEHNLQPRDLIRFSLYSFISCKLNARHSSTATSCKSDSEIRVFKNVITSESATHMRKEGRKEEWGGGRGVV